MNKSADSIIDALMERYFSLVKDSVISNNIRNMLRTIFQSGHDLGVAEANADLLSQQEWRYDDGFKAGYEKAKCDEQKAYAQGAENAWQIARNITVNRMRNPSSIWDDMTKIFGDDYYMDDPQQRIMMDFSSQEAAKMISDYYLLMAEKEENDSPCDMEFTEDEELMPSDWSYRCSKCGKRVARNKSPELHFCPFCGSKIRSWKKEGKKVYE